MKATDSLAASAHELFDRYGIQARLRPAGFAILPLLTLAWPVGVTSLPALVLPILGATGVLLFAVNVVRSRGLRVQERLNRDWDGLPTTHRLRYRDAESQELLVRRRKKIEHIYGQPLPSKRKEQADPAAADKIYAAAIRSLIGKVNKHRKDYPRVHDENITYGYRRNLLGIKWLAVLLAALCLCGDVLLGVFGKVSLGHWVVGGVQVVALAAWLFVVNDSWVRQAADTYTDRLFEALDDLVETA
jgi:hypothetical protein